MTEWLLALVPEYGPWLLAVSTFLSCLALPIPASVLLMAAGGFSASGDLSLPVSIAAALAGALLGDQLGYLAGRLGGALWLDKAGRRVALLGKARDLLARRGGVAVFLTRWLFSALGPGVNLAAGAARQSWAGFTLWGSAGEILWVSFYTGLGFLFAGNLEQASDRALDALGLLAAGAVAIGLGLWLRRVLAVERRRHRSSHQGS